MNVPNQASDQSSGLSASTPGGDEMLTQFRLGFVTLASALIVTLLVVLLPPDGNDRADWMQFIGRFHPLAVHFPIALFLLVPVLEIVGRRARYAYLRRSVNFVLALATIGATTAALLGWCLARSGGYSGRLITQHMWGGVVLSTICWTCWLLSARLREFDTTYGITLVLGVGLVTWTGYRGAQLSLGTNHLTEHMPSRLRTLLRVEPSRATEAAADPNTFFGARIQPIFNARCITCHGEDKHKGNLRLDSYRALMRGGKDGPVIQIGNAQASDLFRRVSLPASHDDFMPKGKSPLTANHLKLIELWIGAGASETIAVDAIKNAPSSASAVVAEVTFPEIDPAAAARLRSAVAPAVSQLQKQFPNILDYDSRISADLRLNASILGSRFGDADLEAFAPIAEHIVVADLSRTAITDHSAAVIATMKGLRVLRIADTRLTNGTLLRLESLNQLESLDVYDTPITATVLPTIAKLPKLAHFYAGQTGIRPGKSVPGNLADKIVF